VDDKPNIVIII